MKTDEDNAACYVTGQHNMDSYYIKMRRGEPCASQAGLDFRGPAGPSHRIVSGCAEHLTVALLLNAPFLLLPAHFCSMLPLWPDNEKPHTKCGCNAITNKKIQENEKHHGRS